MKLSQAEFPCACCGYLTLTFLILGLSSLLLSGCSSMHHAKHWEYKIVPSGNIDVNRTPPPDWPEKQQALLDSLGKDGWILINESNGYFYLRRPVK